MGIGALLGLADWRFELLALLQHTQHLEKNFGVGPHTISVPRLEPAFGSTFTTTNPNELSDLDFCKFIAILRLAVPYTGIILSTRENSAIRRQALALGISQISAGSRTNPGGYNNAKEDASQFYLGDHRSIDEVIKDVANMGYIPSFCTACYRLGRTGENFMKLAKTGKIKSMCQPNALITFKEYLIDYASPETKAVGEKLINKLLTKLPNTQRDEAKNLLSKIEDGQRDIYI